MSTLKVDKRIAMLRDNPDLAAAMHMPAGVKPGIHVDLGPEKPDDRFWIVFSDMDAPNNSSVGGNYNSTRPTYIVKACTRDKGYQALGPMLSIIRRDLTSGPTMVDGYYVGKFVWTGTIRNIDDFKDLRVYWVGYIFTTVVHPTPEASGE